LKQRCEIIVQTFYFLFSIEKYFLLFFHPGSGSEKDVASLLRRHRVSADADSQSQSASTCKHQRTRQHVAGNHSGNQSHGARKLNTTTTTKKSNDFVLCSLSEKSAKVNAWYTSTETTKNLGSLHTQDELHLLSLTHFFKKDLKVLHTSTMYTGRAAGTTVGICLQGGITRVSREASEHISGTRTCFPFVRHH